MLDQPDLGSMVRKPMEPRIDAMVFVAAQGNECWCAKTCRGEA
jgi:hypothetical protein